MKKIETELIELIRNNDNPEQALVTAIEIIKAYLEQSSQCPESSSDDPEEQP